jgi:hypothetical protein
MYVQNVLDVVASIDSLFGQAILLAGGEIYVQNGLVVVDSSDDGEYDDDQYRQCSTEHKNDRDLIKQIFKKHP